MFVMLDLEALENKSPLPIGDEYHIITLKVRYVNLAKQEFISTVKFLWESFTQAPARTKMMKDFSLKSFYSRGLC